MEIKSQKNDVQRLTCLDGLRGGACCCVAFFWHYQHFSPIHFPFSSLAYWPYHYGWIAVEFFFLLSGFIFFYKYFNLISKNIISFKEFFILRLSRLYPLHLFTLIIVSIFQFCRIFQNKDFFVYPNNNLYYFLLNLFFIQNGWVHTDWSFNSPSWSVSVELLAYFLFFLTIKALGKKSSSVYAAFIFYIYLGLVLQIVVLNYPLFNPQIGKVLFCFFIGCLLAKLQEVIQHRKKELFCCCICGVVLFFHLISIILFGYEYAIEKLLGNFSIVYSVLFFPCIILLTINFRFFNKIFSWFPFTFLGDISYSIYLIHFPIQLALVTIFPLLDYSERKTFFLYATLVILLSSLSHFFFERKMQKYIRAKFKL